MNKGNYFQKVLHEQMDEHDINQVELARAINVGLDKVRAWFDGESTPNVHSLRKLSDYFNVSADALVDTACEG